VEKSEKIQVILDNLTLKFPNKHILDKLVEYINFESSNKFTLIFNHNNTANNSRPNTRGTNRSDSPTVRKVSGAKAMNTNNQASQSSNGSNNKHSANNNANKKREKKSATNESARSRSNENKSNKSSIANEQSENFNESFMNETLNSNNNEMIEEVLNKVSFSFRS